MNIAIKINKQTLTALPDGPLVAASVGIVTCTVEFDQSWEGFTRTLVFEREGLARAVLWSEGPLTVPWEVLAQPGLLYISALGVREGMRQPTAVMAEPLSVRPNGLLTGGVPGEFTDSLWSQTLSEVQRLRDEAVQAAEAAIRAAEAAEALAGISPDEDLVFGAVRWAELEDRPIDYQTGDILFLGQIPSVTSWTGTYRDLTANVDLLDGVPYHVAWNGVPYLCLCGGGLGNLSLADPEKPDTGEPFAILQITGGLRIYGYTGEAVKLTVTAVQVTKQLPGDFVSGLLNPLEKTDAMTQPVGVDAEGRLWVEPSAGQTTAENLVTTITYDDNMIVSVESDHEATVNTSVAIIEETEE